MIDSEITRNFEQEDMALRVTARLNDLIDRNQSVPLSTIAELLGAQDFFTMTNSGGKNRAPVFHLDVAGFVKDLKNKRELKLLTLPEELTTDKGIFVPPDAGEIISGNGQDFEIKRIIPRTRYLMEVLSDMNIPYEIYDGVNAPGMMRKLSYKAFLLPTLNKLVLVCNEEGNATFIVHHIDKDENDDLEWRQYAGMTKDNLKQFGSQQVSVVIYDKTPSEWKVEMADKILHGDKEKKLRVAQEDISNKEPAPEGWETVSGLGKKLGHGYGLIKKTAETQRPNHPEWFHFYVDTSGKQTEHLHPDLVADIEHELSAREQAPEGWETVNGLDKKLGHGHGLIKKTAEKYRTDHPEWFHIYDDTSGQQIEHLHPDLVSQIKQELSAREKAPEGWETVNGLDKKLGYGYGLIKKTAETQRPNHPEWFHFYADTSGHLIEHLHPDLVTKIKHELSAREQVPEGWETVSGLGKKLGHGYGLIKKTAEKYRPHHSEWFHFYTDIFGHLIEHLHPDLVVKIIEDLSQKDT